VKFLDERAKGYRFLDGTGLEIGAFEHPADLPSSCSVSYCDRFSMEEAQHLFPEVECMKLVEPNYLLDLDSEGLQQFQSGQQDFIILNHVIEHVVNPLQVLEELFRVLRKGGQCVIAAPDKNHTFDRERPLTSFDDLVKTYEAGVTEVSEHCYQDIITHIHKELIGQEDHLIREHLLRYRERKEHLHIWTSESFREFFVSGLSYLGIKALPLFEAKATVNEFEYFGVWSKQ
jgi:SAM-dependent methyltransferase